MKRRGKGRVVILALLLAVLALAAAIALLCGVSTTGKGETYDAAFAEDRLRLEPCKEGEELEDIVSVSPRGTYILAIGKKWIKDARYQALMAQLNENDAAEAADSAMLYVENTKTGDVTLALPEGMGQSGDKRLARFGTAIMQGSASLLNYDVIWSPDERYAAITKFATLLNDGADLMCLDTKITELETVPCMMIRNLVKWSGDRFGARDYGMAYNACFSPDGETLFYSTIEADTELNRTYALMAYELTSGKRSRVIDTRWEDQNGWNYHTLARDLGVTNAGTVAQVYQSQGRYGVRYLFNDGRVETTAYTTLPIQRLLVSPVSGYGVILYRVDKNDGADWYSGMSVIRPDAGIMGDEQVLLLNDQKQLDGYALSKAEKLIEGDDAAYNHQNIIAGALSPDGQYALLLTASGGEYGLLMVELSSGKWKTVSTPLTQDEWKNAIYAGSYAKSKGLIWSADNRVYLRCKAVDGRTVYGCYSFAGVGKPSGENVLSKVDSRGLGERIQQRRIDELTGTWYFVNDPDDTITFHSDGTYTSESNGLGSWTFSGTYSIEGNQLTLTTTYYGSTTKSTYTYEINGDEMRYGNDTMRRKK